MTMTQKYSGLVDASLHALNLIESLILIVHIVNADCMGYTKLISLRYNQILNRGNCPLKSRNLGFIISGIKLWSKMEAAKILNFNREFHGYNWFQN